MGSQSVRETRPVQPGSTAAPPAAAVQTASLPADGAEVAWPVPLEPAAADAAGEEPQTAGAVQNPPEDEEAGKETDVEELARQVYSQLRRRLLVEWERVRRR